MIVSVAEAAAIPPTEAEARAERKRRGGWPVRSWRSYVDPEWDYWVLIV